MRLRMPSCILLFFILPLAVLQAQDLMYRETKLLPSLNEDDYFGASVDISGDVAVIGAPGANRAYVFRFDGTSWTEQARLRGHDTEVGRFTDHFGVSVDVEGDVIAVGAVLDDHDLGVNVGSVYIFRFDETSWVEEAKLLPHDTGEESRFGVVALQGGTLVVGSLEDDGPCYGGAKCGAAYVFQYDGSNWIEETKLTAELLDAQNHEYFGYAVDVEANRLVVGAWHEGDEPLPEDPEAPRNRPGAAYVFTKDTSVTSEWFQEAKLVASDRDHNDVFGDSVAISGDTIVVGARGDDHGCTVEYPDCYTGSVYVFRFDGTDWTEEAKLTASDARDGGYWGEQFGDGVDISGNFIIVGAPSDDDVATDSGSVYLFEHDGAVWHEKGKIVSYQAQFNSRMGEEVAFDDGNIIAGTVFGKTAHMFGLLLTSEDQIEWLVEEVLFLDLPKGTETGLLAKLDTALKKLEDGKETNNDAAIDNLEEFVIKVEAQRVIVISEKDADALVAAAQAIIAGLLG